MQKAVPERHGHTPALISGGWKSTGLPPQSLFLASGTDCRNDFIIFDQDVQEVSDVFRQNAAKIAPPGGGEPSGGADGSVLGGRTLAVLALGLSLALDLRHLRVKGLGGLSRIATGLMERIQSNYRFVIGFNGALIGLGAAGVLPPAASATLHNLSTLAVSLRSMTDLLPADGREEKER